MSKRWSVILAAFLLLVALWGGGRWLWKGLLAMHGQH